MVTVLIVAPSIRFLSRVGALLPRGPSGSYESPAPVPHTAVPAAQSTDRNVSASVGFSRERIPAPVRVGRDPRKEPSTGTEPACHRCRFLRTRGSGSSGQDLDRKSVV